MKDWSNSGETDWNRAVASAFADRGTPIVGKDHSSWTAMYGIFMGTLVQPVQGMEQLHGIHCCLVGSPSAKVPTLYQLLGGKTRDDIRVYNLHDDAAMC